MTSILQNPSSLDTLHSFHPEPDLAKQAMADIQWLNNPFHVGEIAIQQAMNVQEHVMSYAPQVVRSFLPQQHRDFYTNLPFLVVAGRDEHGQLWSTLLETSSSSNNNVDNDQWVTSPTSERLDIRALPVPGDALASVFSETTTTSQNESMDLGILGIMFESKRRNRVNGRVNSENGVLQFHVDQSFGNCPQYIQPRSDWYIADTDRSMQPLRSTALSPDQIQKVESARTIFTATGYRGIGNDVRFGNDASHRGGPAGFVETSIDGRYLSWIEFSGNNHYNSLGNVIMDDRMGVTIPDFVGGGLLQITGHAFLSKAPNDGIRVHLKIKQVNELPAGSLPVRYRFDGDEKRNLIIRDIVQEADLVKSFYLQPASELPLLRFKAGQYLPIEIKLQNGEIAERTYSLSASPGYAHQKGLYRLSIKRAEYGKVSTFLHDSVKVGDIIKASKPTGDFVLDYDTKGQSDRPIVLLSSGIGVTPVLSMLGELAEKNESKRKVYWVHGARNIDQHFLLGHAEDLVAGIPSATSHIFYSRPEDSSCESTQRCRTGRINVSSIQEIVPDWNIATYYLCGAPSFVSDLTSGLESIGVASDQIHSESF